MVGAAWTGGAAAPLPPRGPGRVVRERSRTSRPGLRARNQAQKAWHAGCYSGLGPGLAAGATHDEGNDTMAKIEIELLAPFTTRFTEGTNLTPSERVEIMRLAQGYGCKDSAAAGNVSPETIRARRKRIYRKLDVPGAGQLLASLLGRSLAMLADGERLPAYQAPSAQPQPAMGPAPVIA